MHSRHAQNAVHRARRKLQQIDRVLQHRLIPVCQPADRIRTRLIEMGVAATGTMLLNFSRAHHATANDVAAFAGRRIGA